MDLLNPTSKRDASHPQHININSHVGCTTLSCDFCGGTNLSLRRYCPLWVKTLTDLLNSTLGRDTSHLQHISMSSRVECTTHMKLPPRDLNLNPYLSYSTSTYTCGVIITPRVRSDKENLR